MNLFTDGFQEAIQLLVSGNESVYSAISVTVTVSSWSLVISLLIGLPLGFLLGYYQFPGKTVIRTIVDNWKTKKNIKLWEQFYIEQTRLSELCKDISYKWVKGHANNEYNNRCDVLASRETEQ